ncbi:MAG TPA: hypothetical protein VIH93_00625 [Thermoanaerobaculia bacterium]
MASGDASRRARAWLLGALVLALELLILVHLHDRFWWPPDEGVYAHPAERMLQGELLHRDVHEAHPAAHFLDEAALALFGDRLVSLRYPLAAAAVAQGLLVFLLLLPAGDLAAAAGSLATTAFGFVQYLSPQPSWYCVFLTVVAAAILRVWPPARRGRSAALGLVAGLALLLRQLSGAFLVAALVTCLLLEAEGDERAERPLLARATAAAVLLALALYLLRSTDLLGFALFGVWPLVLAAGVLWSTRLRARAVASRLGGFAAGGFVAALPLAVYYAWHGALGALFDDTVRGALAVSRLPYLAGNSYAEALGAAVSQLAAHRSFGLVANGLYWLSLPFAAGVLGLLAARRLAVERRADPFVHLAVFSGLVSLLNQIPIYLYYSLTLSLPALLLAVERPRARAAASALVLGLSAIALHDHAAQPLARGEEGVYAGARMGVVPIGIPKLGLWTDPADAAVYRAVLARIESETAAGEPIFAFPNDAELYYLSGRPNPFAFFNTALDVRTPADAAAVVAGLERAKPRLVLFVPDDKYRTPPLEPVVRFVRARYRREARIGRFEVYRLPGPAPAAATWPPPPGAAAR